MLAVVGARDGHGKLGLLSLGDILRLAVSLPEGAEIDGCAGCDELCHSLAQGDHTIATAAIEGDGCVVLTLEDVLDQSGEHGARADLDEGADAGAGHAGDQIDEPNRVRDLSREARLLVLGLGLVGCGGLAGPDRGLCLGELDCGEMLAEGSLTAGDHRGVECGSDQETREAHAVLVHPGLGGFDTLKRSGEHDLGGSIVVGDDHIGLTEVGEQRADGLDIGGDGGHGTGQLAGGGHQLSAAARHTEHVRLGQDAGSVKSGDLAKAVAGHGIGLHPERLHQGEK